MLVGSPVVSLTLSTTCPLPSSNTMIESGYAPRNSVAPGVAAQKSAARKTNLLVFIVDLWENQVEITPVFCSSGALARPVGIVVEMVRHLRGPEAGDVAIVDVALHRLA